MLWDRCPGSRRKTIASDPIGGRAMCPVCTKYFEVRVGEQPPSHRYVIPPSEERKIRENYPSHYLNLQSGKLPQDSQRRTFPS